MFALQSDLSWNVGWRKAFFTASLAGGRVGGAGWLDGT